MSAVFRKCLKPLALYSKITFARPLSAGQQNLSEKDVLEIEIPVPWGHIAGRWWGPKDRRPILCLHGWQDNANTFNTLIPQMSPAFSYLAIDLPGHGFSTHYPKGSCYKHYEVASTIRRLQSHFDWSKMSLIGHSYGGGGCVLFASFFPDSVDFVVTIDIVKPLTNECSSICKRTSGKITKFLKYESQSVESAPTYTIDDLLKTWIKGSGNSLSEESCQILIQRGAIENNGLYKLNRDVRVKELLGFGFTQKEHLKLAETITCNLLYLKASDAVYFEKEENVFDVINVLKKKTKYFEEHTLKGSHHIHLNSPEVVAPVINSFIKTIGGQK